VRRPGKLGGYDSAVAVDQELVNAAVRLIDARFPAKPWAGAAAVLGRRLDLDEHGT
jgi:hypothetical protein